MLVTIAMKILCVKTDSLPAPALHRRRRLPAAAPPESGNELLFHCYLFPVPPPHNDNPRQFWLFAIQKALF